MAKAQIYDILSEDSPGFIYLIYDGRHYKIGTSKNVKIRLSQIKSHNPTVQLVCKVFSDKYLQLERFFHERYNAFRIGGEWFDFPANIEIEKEFISVAKELEKQIENIDLPNKYSNSDEQTKNKGNTTSAILDMLLVNYLICHTSVSKATSLVSTINDIARENQSMVEQVIGKWNKSNPLSLIRKLLYVVNYKLTDAKKIRDGDSTFWEYKVLPISSNQMPDHIAIVVNNAFQTTNLRSHLTKDLTMESTEQYRTDEAFPVINITSTCKTKKASFFDKYKINVIEGARVFPYPKLDGFDNVVVYEFIHADIENGDKIFSGVWYKGLISYQRYVEIINYGDALDCSEITDDEDIQAEIRDMKKHSFCKGYKLNYSTNIVDHITNLPDTAWNHWFYYHSDPSSTIIFQMGIE